MVYIIILHALIQRIFVSDPGEFETTVKSLPLIFVLAISPLIIISLWGTVFSLITGVAVAYQMGSVVKENPANTAKLEKILKSRLFTCIMIYVVYFLNNILFATRSIEHGFKTQSLLTGTLETLTFKAPNFYSLTATSTLETIAISGVVVSSILYLAWYKRKTNPMKVVKILVKLAIGVLIISLILREILGDPLPIQEKLIANGNYLWYFIFMRLYPARFALFPVLAFSLMGASMGILLSQKIPFAKFAKFTFSYAALFIGIFGLYMLNGFDVIKYFADEFAKMPLHFLNLGLQMIVVTVVAYRVDYCSANVQKQRLKRSKIFQNYSNASLTIFVLEPFIASALYLGYRAAFGDFVNSFFLIVSFMVNLVLIWHGLLALWKKAHFKGNCEWVVGKGKQWLSNRRIFNRKNQNHESSETSQIWFNREFNMLMKH